MWVAGVVGGDALAAAAMVSAANRRAIEVRAEAAMLVEAVEDRAASVSAPPLETRCTLKEGVHLLIIVDP